MKSFICFLCLFVLFGVGQSQTIGVGEWNVHGDYAETSVMMGVNNDVYVGTKSGLFVYNNDNSLSVFSKVDGMSSVEISALAHDDQSNSIFVGYVDGNLDVLQKNLIVNIPDIYLSNVLGDKRINNIFIDNNLAYISCSFGLVVYNLEKREVKETCYFYSNGAAVDVYQTHAFNAEVFSLEDVFLANKVFVGTSGGLFYADKNANLVDQSVWQNNAQYTLPQMSAGSLQNIPIKHVVGFSVSGGKKLLIGSDFNSALAGTVNNNYNLFEAAPLTNTDPLIFNAKNVPGSISSFNYNRVAKRFLVTTDNNGGEISVLNPFLETVFSQNLANIAGLQSPSSLSLLAGLVLDNYNSSGQLLLGDVDRGSILVRAEKDKLNFLEFVCPNGPASTGVGAMDSYGETLMITHGAKKGGSQGGEGSWNNTDNYEEVSFFNSEQWESSDELIDMGVYDAVSGCVVENNRFFVGTWNSGLLEFFGNELVGHYKPSNTPELETLELLGPDVSRIGGVDLDDENNIWLTNSQTSKVLVKFSLSNNSWSSFSVPGLENSSQMSGSLLCASNGNKWIQLRSSGVMVVKQDGGKISSRTLTSGSGLPDGVGDVNCFEEDQDGAVWIGGSLGLSVVYFPDEIFNNSSSAEPVLVETEDGHVERLFGNMNILDIKTDGGNRKWIATKTNGVFLVSEDGAEQVYSFQKENSPLLDNTVYNIDIIGPSGEVFFATAKGLCSYRSDATQNQSEFENVIIFPNPVKKDYAGEIAIRGLTNGTNVKITDISGNLVFETTSLGGTATWDGNRFNGERVKTGVYLFLCTSEDFKESIVKKVLIY